MHACLSIKKINWNDRIRLLEDFLDNFISSFYSHVFQHRSDDKNVSFVLSWVCQQDSILGYQKKTGKNIKKKKKKNTWTQFIIKLPYTKYKYNFIHLNLHSKALTEAKDFLCFFFPLIKQWFEITRVIRFWQKNIITIAK